MPTRQPSIAVRNTIADLQGISPSTGLVDYKSIFVIGEGLYVWREGDQSANLPDATNEWVAPSSDTSGASGAWQKDIESGLAGAGGGVAGPGSSTDNAVARFDGTGGSTIQDSGVIIDDDDNVSGAGTLIAVKTTDFTLALSDNGKTLEGNSATAQSITVPENASTSLPVGFQVDVVQIGAGQITFVEDTNVTIRKQAPSTLKILSQYGAVTLYKRATNEWVLIGDLE